jgi:AraC family transcriptional regulator, transcriptional activator of pobA
MQPKIPFLSLQSMLDDLQYDWHSPHYYIAPDEVISEPRFKEPFRPKFYGVILCVEGWMDLLVNGEKVRLDPNRFFAGGPNMVLQRAGQSRECKNKAVFFTKEFLVQNQEGFRHFESFHFFSTHYQEAVKLSESEAQPLVQLYEILQSKRNETDAQYHNEIIRNLISAYVYETAMIYHQEGREFPSRVGKEADLNNRFRQLISQHATQEHRLPFYAEALFVTPKYLIQAIKKVTGHTPGELIDEALVTEARILLHNPALSMESIAEQLHFADPATFSRFFKKHTGMSPTVFRKSKG